METENVVFVEDERGTIEKTPEECTVTIKKQDQPLVGNDDQSVDVSVTEEEKSVDITKIKSSNTLSASNGGSAKSDKAVANNKDNAKGRGPLSSNSKRGLSQSMSFPDKGAMKKTVDGLLVKGEAKSTRLNREKPKGEKVNGSVSTARLNPTTKRATAGVNSKENDGGPTSRRATIASIPSSQRSLSGKPGSINGAAKAASSEGSLSVDKQLQPVKTGTLIKEDEDARSTTSSNTSARRRSESGFSFRLYERAEKRKEFFSKFEEKMQAKEAEKNNIQAKTMENQEAELKQLRKSLTFKATPMPRFYKEPPTKVELKKIPNTRPKSPKLGRNKSFSTTKPNPSGGEESVLSPRLNQNEGKSAKTIQANSIKDASTLKRPVKKSASKVHSHKQAFVKAAEKVVDAEKETNTKDSTSDAEKMEENESKSVDSCEVKDEIKDEHACEVEILAAEVVVEG